jgi:hypothetical protein
VTTCEKCKTRPPEYGLQPGEQMTVRYRATDGAVATQTFRPGKFCESCMEMEMLNRANSLSNQQEMRELYRQVLARRRAENDPITCSDCRREQREFLYLTTEATSQGVLCQSCLYVQLRNEMLRKATAIGDASARCNAMLAAIKQQSKKPGGHSNTSGDDFTTRVF